MKLVAAYLFRHRILVASYSQATTGMWIENHEYVQVPSDCIDAEIGALVIRQSAHCQIGIPHPDRRALSKGDWGLPRFAGARSAAAFERGAHLVHVEWRGPSIAVTPQRRHGSAWEGLRDLERIGPSDIASEQLGALVRECLRVAADADASPEDHAPRPAKSARVRRT